MGVVDTLNLRPLETGDGELNASFRIPHDAPPKRLLVLTAYVDETGQDTKDFVFLAGFYGNDEQWRRFATAWKSGLGNCKALHMRDLRWSGRYLYRTKRLLARLGPIPHECGLQPILGGVRVSDYADLIQGTIEQRVLSGYAAALYPLVLKTLLAVPDDERIELVFEAQDRYQPAAEMILRSIANRPCDPRLVARDGQPKLANWRFVPKSSTALTQPADYFAYSLTQAYRDKKSAKTRLCSPIFKDGDDSEAVGAIMSKRYIRSAIQFTQTMVDLELLTGLDLKPKNPSDEASFANLVREFVHAEKP